MLHQLASKADWQVSALPILQEREAVFIDRPYDLFEDALCEEVEIVLPFGSVVGIPVHVPYVTHSFFFEVVVDALADADQAVLISAGKPNQLKLLRDCWVRQQLDRRFRVRRRG